VGGLRRQAARTESAVAVTAAASPRGNEIMEHVAARMGLPMAANVVGLNRPMVT
jgi:electron transfer flavoprotein alpha subunit